MSLFHWLSCVSEAYDMILLPVCPDISPQKSKIKECGPNMTDAEVLPSPVVDLELELELDSYSLLIRIHTI